MTNILITGGDGQLGQAFNGLGRNNLILANRQQLDITSEAQVQAFIQQHQIGLVINGAAYTAVDKAESEPEQAYRINRDGAEAVARACRETGAGLIHISTDYVFDGEKTGAWLESDPVNPQGVYGASKLAGEQVVLDILPQAVVVRTSWVFSEYGNNFLKTMLRLAQQRDQLGIVHDQVGGPSYAPHIAQACLQLAEQMLSSEKISSAQNSEKPSGIRHFCGEPVVSWYEFAEAIFTQRAARPEGGFSAPELSAITSDQYPTPAKRPANSALCCDQLRQELNGLNNDWREGIRLALEAILSAEMSAEMSAEDVSKEDISTQEKEA